MKKQVLYFGFSCSCEFVTPPGNVAGTNNVLLPRPVTSVSRCSPSEFNGRIWREHSPPLQSSPAHHPYPLRFKDYGSANKHLRGGERRTYYNIYLSAGTAETLFFYLYGNIDKFLLLLFGAHSGRKHPRVYELRQQPTCALFPSTGTRL